MKNIFLVAFAITLGGGTALAEGCGTDDVCNDPFITNIDNGGNEATALPAPTAPMTNDGGPGASRWAMRQ